MFLRNLLLESKQSIVNLGFPPIIAALMKQKFGSNAYLISKWFKDSVSYRPMDNWWKEATERVGSWYGDLYGPTLLYTAATTSPQAYEKACKYLGIDDTTVDDMDDHLKSLKEQIEESLFKHHFFKGEFIREIVDGKLKTLKQFENLSFSEAEKKFSEKKVFKDAKPLIQYPNGYRWINVGDKCTIVGKGMNNCGSAGFMSNDPNRTIFTLFDEHDNPHVISTYSPNDNIISGVEGKASSELKDQYADYVVDLINKLGATYDANRSKSKLLTIKINSKNKAENIQKIPTDNQFYNNYQFSAGGKTYFTDGEVAFTKDDLEVFVDNLKDDKYMKSNIGDQVGYIFSRFREIDLKNLKPDFRFIHINQL
jgi:hypothetical protein